MLHKLIFNLIVLYVNDLEQSRNFYEALGLELVKEQHGKGVIHYSCELGETILELYPHSAKDIIENKVQDLSRLGFQIISLEKTLMLLGEVKIFPNSPVRETAHKRSVCVYDPDGRVIELSEISIVV